MEVISSFLYPTASFPSLRQGRKQKWTKTHLFYRFCAELNCATNSKLEGERLNRVMNFCHNSMQICNLQFSSDPAVATRGCSIRAGSFVRDEFSWIVPSEPDLSIFWCSTRSCPIGSKHGSARVSYCRYLRLNALGGLPAGYNVSPYSCRLFTFGVIGRRVETSLTFPLVPTCRKLFLASLTISAEVFL